MSAAVILLAAGSGQRFGGAVSKQFVLLNKKPLLLHSLQTFLGCSFVREVVVVVAASELKKTSKLLNPLRLSSRVHVAEGGSFRGQSVQKGFQSLRSTPQVVLIHDAARPLVTPQIIEDVYCAALKTGVSLAAWMLSDTLKKGTAQGRVLKTVPRKNLWCAQTPQGFRWDRAQKCLLKPSPSSTDDVELAQKRKFPVALVSASPTNIKITYPQDLEIASALLKV